MNKGKDKNLITGCIYKHPQWPVEEFHYQFLSPILEKVSFKNKDIYLIGDFNINLLNYESGRHTSHFFDDIYSSNIYHAPNTHITDITDHLTQFIITPKILQREPKKNYKRCFKTFNEYLFENNLKNINSGALLNLEVNDANFSFSQLIQKINELLDIHAPYKYFKPKIKKT